VLQRVEVCCIVLCVLVLLLRRTSQTSDPVCCSVLQGVAVCDIVLQCVAVCDSVLQCVAVCCSVRQCVIVFSGLIAESAFSKVSSSVLQCAAM